MLTYNNYYDAIDEIKSFLHMDLIGPITEDEIIENIEPLSYYTMGIVWPKSTKNERDTEKLSLFDIYNSDIEDDINLANDVISDANIYEPSGMGVSVMLPANATSLNVDFAFAKYVLHKTEKNKTYERKPYNLTTTFLVPNICKFILCTENNNFKNLGVEISLCVRKIMHDGRKLVTVSVSNILVASSDKKLKNEYALFQCKLSLRSEIGFLPIHQNKHFENNIDDQITAMQYRNVLNYANGHGCSVFYEKSNFVTHICSDFLPYERVFLMKSVTLKQNDLLKLNYWNTADRDDACNKLLLFINEYESWYKSLDTHNISGYKNAINTVFGRIDTCIKRLKDGVRVLKTNDAAYQSFKLMNEAMLLQRINSKNLSNNEINNIEWYPFQLAYILQVVPDITEPNSKCATLITV